MWWWIDRIPLGWLSLVALWLLVAPVFPEPHLFEKLRMLSQGELVRPLDIFDLCFHGLPQVLLAARLRRQWRR